MANPSANAADTPVPLCADLDGTLIKTDLLWESMVRLLRRNPLWLVVLPLWWLQGRAHLKRQIAARVGPLDVARLPFNAAFLEYLRAAHRQGRPILLATASDGALARQVAEHVGLFREVLASDGKTNLRGETKLRKLVEQFGERGFDYAGNSSVDLAVWRLARAAIVVNASPRLARRAAQLTQVAATFDEAHGRAGAILEALHVWGWSLNLLVLVPLLMVAWWQNPAWLWRAALGFAAFSFGASAVRIGFQLFDLDTDRQVSGPRQPPLASGQLPLQCGLALLPVLLALSYAAATVLGWGFVALLTIFVALEAAYLRRLRTIKSVGAFVLACLCALRLAAGGVALGVTWWAWLFTAIPLVFVGLVLVKWPGHGVAPPRQAAPAVVPEPRVARSVNNSPEVSAGARRDLVLVTGSLGWLGSRLVEVLLHGLPGHPTLGQPRPDLQIRCLVQPGQNFLPLAKLSDRIRIVVGDLRLPGDCARFCAGAQGALLLHAAGVVHPGRVAAFYRVNRDGTRALLDAAIAAGVERAVIVSSAALFDWSAATDQVLDEASPCNPRLAEGRATLDLEMAVRQRSDRIETVIIRTPRFYGPNSGSRQVEFFKQVREGKAPVIGTGQQPRSLAYIDNVCQGVLLAAQVGRAAGRTYWIADGRAYLPIEILDTTERLLEAEFGQVCAHRRRRWPALVGDVARFAGVALETIGLHREECQRIAEKNQRIVCSAAKAEAELGYQPAVELEEGVRRTLRWCAEKGLKF